MRCHFLFISTRTVFLYRCDLHPFSFSFLVVLVYLTHILPPYRLQWMLGALSISLPYPPHGTNPSISHLHPILTARLRFDHLNPLILNLYLSIYSQPPFFYTVLYILSFFAASHRYNSNFVCSCIACCSTLTCRRSCYHSPRNKRRQRDFVR